MYHSWHRHVEQYVYSETSHFFVVIAILTPFRWPPVKGQRSIYTKVSLPCQVRFRRGNVTKIELALPSPSPRNSGPHFTISDVSSCPDGLMPRKIENPRLRKPDIPASSSKLTFLAFSMLPSGRYWRVLPKPFPGICSLHFFKRETFRFARFKE